MTEGSPKPQRIAATWYLGAVFAVLLLLVVLRGAGRPLLLAGLVVFAVVKIVRAVLRPLP